MKVRPGKLTKQQKIETLDALYTATTTLKGRATVKRFLRDLLTESERVMLGRRIIIARMLIAGESQASIKQALGVGNDTIWRVQQWLGDQIPGYEEIIVKVEAEFKKRRYKYKTPQLGTFAYLKKKYPLHFLLLPIPKTKKRIPKQKNKK